MVYLTVIKKEWIKGNIANFSFLSCQRVCVGNVMVNMFAGTYLLLLTYYK